MRDRNPRGLRRAQTALCACALAQPWQYSTAFVLPAMPTTLSSLCSSIGGSSLGATRTHSARPWPCLGAAREAGAIPRAQWSSGVGRLRGGADDTLGAVDDSRSSGTSGDTGDDLPATTAVVAVELPTEPKSTTTTTKDTGGGLFALTEHDGHIFALALPALLSLLVDPILSLVDTAYVGRGLGAISLAALGPCTSIFHFSFNTFRSLTQSTTALVSTSLAAGDKEKAGQIVQQMYVLACLLGAGLQVTLLTQAPAILTLMGAGPTTALFADASAYLKVRALAAPAVLIIMVSEGVFRGHADTRAPAAAALSAAIANTILDPVLMFALGLGMAGAAGATALAQYFAVAIYGTMLWRGARKGSMEVPFFFSRKNRQEGRSGGGGDPSGAVKAWPLLVKVISANAAMLLRTTSLMACWAVATAVATRMSSAAVGAHQVALSLWLLFALVAEAPSIAAQVLGARYLGQGKLETARSMGHRVASVTLACSGFLGTTLLLLSRVIPRCFTSDPAVLKRLGKLLPLLAFQQPLIAMTLVTEGLLVGAGQFRWLGTTTVCSSALSAWFIVEVGRRAPSWDVVGIWMGITAMFVGRLSAAAWRLLDRNRGPYWVTRSENGEIIRRHSDTAVVGGAWSGEEGVGGADAVGGPTLAAGGVDGTGSSTVLL